MNIYGSRDFILDRRYTVQKESINEMIAYLSTIKIAPDKPTHNRPSSGPLHDHRQAGP